MLTNKNPKKTDWENMPLAEMALGNCTDSDFTLRVYNKLKPQLKELGVETYYETLITKMLPKFAKIEYRGMTIDPIKLEEVGKTLKEKNTELYNSIREMHYDKDTNPSSGDDLADFLFTDDRGIGLYPPLLTKGKKPATNKECLVTLLDMINERIQSEIK